MIFIYLAKTLAKKWINALSKRGFSRHLVIQATHLNKASRQANTKQDCCPAH